MTLAARTFFDTSSDRLTPQMEQEFFSSIMGRNKTYKTTFHGRFSEINQFLVKQARAGALRLSKILDVGVSSGISTLELLEDMRAAGCKTSVIGTDILTNAHIVKVAPGCYALLDASGFPLRFDLVGRGVKPWVAPADYRNGMFVLRKAINLLFTRRAKRILGRANDPRVRKVRLLSPRVCSNSGIAVHDDNIAQYNPEFSARFDFIRAANVLNKNYFPDAALTGMVENLKRYLTKSNGSLLVVRTHEDLTNHGTLFRLADNGSFEVLTRFGDGSEIESLVLRA
jgi:hypothetical protein